MLATYCESACVDGIRELYMSRSHKPKFIFWSVVMALMFISSIWFTYKTVIGYLDTDTVTCVSTIRAATMEMPEVLICYNGGLNISAMREANLSENLIKLLHWQLYKLYTGKPIEQLSVELDVNQKCVPNKSVDDSDMNSAANEFQNYIDQTNLGVIDIIDRFSYSCDEMVAQFIRPTSSVKNCASAVKLVTPKGNCYSFVNNSYQTYPQFSAGLFVQLKSPKNSFYETYPNEQRQYDMGNDFSFTIEKTVGGEQSGRWITIAPYTRTEVTLWTKRYKRLANNVECENDPSFRSSNTCFNRCYIKTYIEVCNCMENTGWTDFFGKNVSACNPFDQQCTLNQTHIDEFLACQRSCKPMCSEWIFETSISSNSVGSSKCSQSIVKIAYNTMQYISIEEVDAFTLDMAIANVGGQSGLWLGCSIITIIQAIYYSIASCVNYCYDKRLSMMKMGKLTIKLNKNGELQ